MSDYIPEDNVSLILRCLPVKSLLRFRCVSKGWKEIIDSPLFVQEHLSLQNPNFIFQNEASSEIYALSHDLPSVNLLNYVIEDEDDLQGDPIFDPGQFLFLATHNGVVCLYASSSSSHMFGTSSQDNLVLWNPSIREHLTVEIPGDIQQCLEAESCFGFWIDPFTKEFKFIIVDKVMEEENKDRWDDPIGMKGIVYSSVRPDWREISNVELGYWLPYPTVMIQGVAHWRGIRSADNACIILSFDFIHERFDTIEMPVLDGRNELGHFYWPGNQFRLDGKNEPRHFHWQGNLSVVVKDHRYSACNNHILYIRQDGLWIKMFDFNLLPSLRNIFWVFNEEDRARVLVGYDHDVMVFYDTRDGKLIYPDENTDEYDDRLDHICLFTDGNVAFDFVESLLFP